MPNNQGGLPSQHRVLASAAAAYVLYVMVSVGAAQVAVDAGALSLALVALVCALLPLRLSQREQHGAGLVSWLSAALSCLLAATLASEVHPLSSELAQAMSLPVLGAVTLRLALHVPDRPVRLMRHLGSELFLRLLAGVGLVLGVLAALPPLWLSGRPLIAPHWLSWVPFGYALGCVVLATLVRLARRRLGSDARALSANLWATLGSLLGLLLAGAVAALRLVGHSTSGAEQATLALSALVFVVGHGWLVTPRRAAVAAPWARQLLSLSLAFAVAAVLFMAVEPHWPRDVLGRVLLCGLLVGTFAASRFALGRAAALLLAPHRGRLLKAIDQAMAQALGAPTYEELAARVLRPLRRAADVPEAAPLLVFFQPAREVRLDAAGLARVSPRQLPPAVAQRLRDFVGEPIVLDDLRARLVRRPELRDLVWSLDELDALCVMPLLVDGQLEGALVVARGLRTAPLTLEELSELERLTDWLAKTAEVFLLAERTNLRLSLATSQCAELKVRTDDLTIELDESRAELALLKAGGAGFGSHADVVAYSAPMRELVQRLEKVAGDDVTVLLISEPGTPLVPLARVVHEASGRSEKPFVVGDCAELAAEDAMAALFGSRAGPGFLELSAQGTLVLLDLPALDATAQLALARALSEKRAYAVHGGSGYEVDVRIVATVRKPVTDLVSSGALSPDLGRWFANVACAVPPLRDRREDIESLVLRALDRGARVWGREVLGVTPEALRALVDYDWPGNVQELEMLVERAVAQATGTRIGLEDLPPLPAGTLTVGSFVDQEREILRRALERAGGSRTRAARALGLKRTTLVDKLRRLGLEDGAGPAQH
jgi:transcriptional regulator with GAF, ATPase, and Fis domain